MSDPYTRFCEVTSPGPDVGAPVVRGPSVTHFGDRVPPLEWQGIAIRVYLGIQ